MSKKPRNPRARFSQGGTVATQVLPVLDAPLQGSITFLPNRSIGGCLCVGCGGGRILVRTGDVPEADHVFIGGQPVGRLAQRMVHDGTNLRVGIHEGQLFLRPVRVSLRQA